MMRTIKGILALGIAAGCLAGVQARAADLDGTVFTDDANFSKPAELGSGWYIRGDVYYNAGEEQRIGFNYDEISGDTFDYRYGNGFGYGIGAGYKFNNWLRMDATLDRPIASDFTYNGSATFRGSRLVDYTYNDGNNDVTITRTLFFDSNGTVTGSTCTQQEQNDGWCSVPATTLPIDGSRKDEFGYSVWTVMANAYVDLPTVARFTPYVGAGLGLSRANAWYKLTVDCVATADSACGYPAGSTGEVLRDQVLVDNTYARWLPTWSVSAGTSYAINDNVSLDIGYRFMRVQDIESVVSGSGVVNFPGKNLDLHQVRVGLRMSTW